MTIVLTNQTAHSPTSLATAARHRGCGGACLTQIENALKRRRPRHTRAASHLTTTAEHQPKAKSCPL